MNRKTAVQFRKTQTTARLFQRLKQCRRCGGYSCLWHDECLSCGADRAWIGVPEAAKAVERHAAQASMLTVGAIGALAFVLARNSNEMALALAGTVLLLGLYIFMRWKFKPVLYRRTLGRILLREQENIREGLLRDIGDAESDLKAGEIKTAYEKFREIGILIEDEAVKRLQVFCLNHFILRSDMQLELAALMPGEFDPDFIRYMHEVGKVRPQLLSREVLDYVLRHRGAIAELPEGPHVLTAAAGAALRVKGYLTAYRPLLLERAASLPKERLLRLCRLLAENPEADPELAAKARDAVRKRYNADPEFQGMVQKG